MPTISETSNSPQIHRLDTHWAVAFTAMACPCEILIRTNDRSEVERLASLAHEETLRIERKFSRYRRDNIVNAINSSEGAPVRIDDETRNLLLYAGECYRLSEGLFDITSGILRRAWSFDGREVVPDQTLIDSLLTLVGWDKVEVDDCSICLRPEMQIDLGGIGKEYAVDRVCQTLREICDSSIMVNFGGDIRSITASGDSDPWIVGIEDPEDQAMTLGVIEIANGAIATSGSSYRHCFVNGRRLGHILNPITGWPIEDAPRSVTVVGDLCSEAGLLSTLAMLKGPNAEQFLEAQAVRHLCVR